MLQYTGMIALDLARERTREIERAAARHRLAVEAGDVRGTGRPPHRDGIRALIARPVRAFGSASRAVSTAACIAAARIEGGTA